MIEWNEQKPATYTRVLNHVKLGFPQAKLTGEVLLRRATDADVQLFQESQRTGFTDFGILGNIERDATLAETRLPGSPLREGRRRAGTLFERLHLALRLLKAGSVTLGAQFESQKGGYVDRYLGFLPLQPDWGFLGSQLELYDHELADLAHLFEGLADPPAGTNVALNRFDLGCRRQDRLDRFIDWWVALESLFGDDPGELTYKLSLRIAYVTCGPDERPALARDLRRAYAARSSVVHGRQPKEIRHLEDVVGRSLRIALTKLVSSGKRLDLQLLDDYIARGDNADN